MKTKLALIGAVVVILYICKAFLPTDEENTNPPKEEQKVTSNLKTPQGPISFENLRLNPSFK